MQSRGQDSKPAVLRNQQKQPPLSVKGPGAEPNEAQPSPSGPSSTHAVAACGRRKRECLRTESIGFSSDTPHGVRSQLPRSSRGRGKGLRNRHPFGLSLHPNTFEPSPTSALSRSFAQGCHPSQVLLRNSAAQHRVDGNHMLVHRSRCIQRDDHGLLSMFAKHM